MRGRKLLLRDGLGELKVVQFDPAVVSDNAQPFNLGLNNQHLIIVMSRSLPASSMRCRAEMRSDQQRLAKLSHPHPPETGILTDSAAAPYVVVTAGSLTADTRLRVQVEHNVQDDILAFKLIDMRDGGAQGMIVPATGNGEFVLPGFSGSAVSSLSIKVNNYAALKTLVVNEYDGRLVDVLDVRVG